MSLHKRNPTNKDKSDPPASPLKDKVGEDPQGQSAMDQEETGILEQNKRKDNRNRPEVPVVSMVDFEVVDVNDKLNLLMAAINKINTNFHYKFEDLKEQVTSSIDNLQPQLSRVEQNLQEGKRHSGLKF